MKRRTEEMPTIEQRREMLLEIMKYYKLDSQAELARRLGITAQNMSSWFNKNAFNVELVAIRFPEISCDWLLRGEGPMLKRDRDGLPPSIDDSTEGAAPIRDLNKALAALAQEQKLTAKAQEQADKILEIMHSLATSFKRLANQ